MGLCLSDQFGVLAGHPSNLTIYHNGVPAVGGSGNVLKSCTPVDGRDASIVGQDDLNDWHNWVSNDHSISRKDGLCALKRIIQNHLDINVYSETERIQAVALLADIDAALAML